MNAGTIKRMAVFVPHAPAVPPGGGQAPQRPAPMVSFVPEGYEPKAITTLMAQAALGGYELQVLPAGDVVVARWGRVQALASIEAAREWLRRAGVDC